MVCTTFCHLIAVIGINQNYDDIHIVMIVMHIKKSPSSVDMASKAVQ